MLQISEYWAGYYILGVEWLSTYAEDVIVPIIYLGH